MYGCIDIGSNTTRLLVAEVSRGRVRTRAARRVFTRIGASVGKDGRIPDQKVDEVARVAGALAAEARELGCEQIALLGTAAVRQAENGGHLRQAVESATALPMRVLDGDQEAQLSFAGARAGLEGRDVQRLTVVDVGGGSTELATGSAAGPADWTTSIAIGSSVLCTHHPAADPPTPAELDAWRERTEAELAAVAPPPADVAVAVGGTATSLHRLTGPRLTSATLGRALERLCERSSAASAAALDIDPERTRLMPAGITVLAAVARVLGTELRAGRGGLREGAVLELAA